MSRDLRVVGVALLSLLAGTPAFADVDPVTEPAPSAFAHGGLTGNAVVRFEGRTDPPAGVLEGIVSAGAATEFVRLEGRWPIYKVVLDGADPVAFAKLLESRPDVTWADADRWFEARPDALNDPMWDELWHLENVAFFSGARPQADANAVPAWEHSTGEGVVVAVIDTGVDMDHPDLRVLPEGYDPYDSDRIPEPNLESEGSPAHGTAVAGIIAAIGDNGIGVAGVAHGASIYGVRMLGDPGLAETDLYNSLVRPVDDGAHVLNNSWGSIDSECSPVPNRPLLNSAVEYARIEGRGGLGTVVVFSAGNSGCEVTQYPMQEQPGVISVGSLRDDDLKFPYSCWGRFLDIMAPSGVGSRQGIRTTDIYGDAGYNGRGENAEYTHRMGGTSAAAPVVSGVVALMLAANPRLTEADVRRVLCDTAVRITPEVAQYDSTGWSNTHGCGRVDAAAAVAAVVNAPPSAPGVLRPSDAGEQILGDVLVQWGASTDPDGDPLRYDVEIVDLLAEPPEGDDDDSAEPEPFDPVTRFEAVADTRLNLSETLELGEYSVQVWARDAWGRGEGSTVTTFAVVPEPPPAAPGDDDDDDDPACGGGDASAAGLLLLAPLGAVRRRGARRSRTSG